MLEVLVWRLGWRIGQVCSIHQQPVTCNGSESPNGKKRLSQNSCTLLSQSHLLSTQLQTTPSPLFRLLPPPVTLNRPELPLAPGSLQIPSNPSNPTNHQPLQPFPQNHILTASSLGTKGQEQLRAHKLVDIDIFDILPLAAKK